MTANDERQFGRAKNAVLSYFERKLSVPKIYIDEVWSQQHVDVLAIDRDGVGDVHAALLFRDEYFLNGRPKLSSRIEGIKELYRRFELIPAQYKYVVAIPVGSHVPKVLSLSPDLSDQAFSQDGIGRIGLASVELPVEDEPQTKLLVKPERFRAKIAQLADEFFGNHTAAWELRA